MNKQQIVNYTREILSEAIPGAPEKKIADKHEPAPVTNIIVTNRGESWLLIFFVCLIFLFVQAILPVKAVILYPIVQSENYASSQKQFFLRKSIQNESYYADAYHYTESKHTKQQIKSNGFTQSKIKNHSLKIADNKQLDYNSPKPLSTIFATQLGY